MTKNTKYAFTAYTQKLDNGVELRKIVALKDFGDVKKGEVGGWLELEDNLSFDGDAWVHDEAKVWGNAKVFEDAQVRRNTQVYGNAKVYGNAQVWSNAKVYENAVVCGDTRVFGNVEVFGNARVSGHAHVSGCAKIYGNAVVSGSTQASQHVEVFGNAQVFGKTHLYGKAKVASVEDYIVFKNSWSSGRFFTWTKSNDMWLVGCFYGTGEELIEKAYKDSEESGRKYELYVNLVKELQK